MNTLKHHARTCLWPWRIREWRVRHRWTQKQLAANLRRLDRCCACDNGTVSRWERGTHRPSALHEHLLCVVFEDRVLDGIEVPREERMAYVRRVLGLDTA